ASGQSIPKVFFSESCSTISSAPSPVETEIIDVIPAMKNKNSATLRVMVDLAKTPINMTKIPRINPTIGKWFTTKCACAVFISSYFVYRNYFFLVLVKHLEVKIILRVLLRPRLPKQHPFRLVEHR